MIRKVLSSPPVPVAGISVLQDIVESLSTHLPSVNQQVDGGAVGAAQDGGKKLK